MFCSLWLHESIFYSTAKNLSYSKAAKELYISQPSVSIQIKKLEQELDIVMFEQFGGAGTTPGIYLLPELIGEFKKYHKKIEIDLQISGTEEIVKKLLCNGVDFALVGAKSIQNQKDLKFKPIAADQLVLIVSKRHPLANREEVSFEEIKEELFILREEGSSTREIFINEIKRKDICIKVGLQFTSVEAIKKAVAANIGVSIVSEQALKLEKKINELAVLKITDLNLERNINLVYHKEKKFTKAMEHFLGYFNHLLKTN